MNPINVITIVGIIFSIITSIFIYMLYKQQKSLVAKDAKIEENLAKEKFYLKELNRWETYNVGLLGDIAHLVDNHDLNKRNEIRNKWKANFHKKKEMFKERQGLNKPEAKN